MTVIFKDIEDLQAHQRAVALRKKAGIKKPAKGCPVCGRPH